MNEIKHVDLGYDYEDDEEYNLRDYIRDCGKRALYKSESISLKDVESAAYLEDGVICRLKDGRYFEYCDRGVMGTRGWYLDKEFDKEWVEELNSKFESQA